MHGGTAVSAMGLFDALGMAVALPGARCRGRHQLFDEAQPGEDVDNANDRHSRALVLCAECPALAKCADWVDGLPKRDRPTGVVGGRVIRPGSAGRPRRSA